MRHRTRITLAALSAATLGLTLAGCFPDVPAGSSPAGPGPVKACDTRSSAPILSMETGRPTILAQTESVCDVSPATHQVTIWLERETAADVWAIYGDHYPCPPDLPGPGHTSVCKFHTFNCESGHYRTRAIVSGTGPDGNGFTFTVPEMPDNVIACPKG